MGASSIVNQGAALLFLNDYSIAAQSAQSAKIRFGLRVRHPSAILAALISLCRAQGLVEPSLRQRYHIRRQNIAARRRRIGLAIGGVVLLIILGVAILRQPTPVSAPGVLAPTSAAMRTPTSDARQTPTGQ